MSTTHPPSVRHCPAQPLAVDQIVVFSLERWDDIWRRNQFFVDALLQRHPALRVLFVEPPTDPVHALVSRKLPELPRLRRVHHGRVWAMRPLKPLPRRLGSFSDRMLRSQVTLSMRLLSMTRPVLWINDATYAPMVEQTQLPTVYDITDDWLLGPLSPREVERLQAAENILFEHANEVVVCSPTLAATRGTRRDVTLIPNAVDADHFRRPQPRPADLPRPPVAVYAGSLHESRLDVDLVVRLAESIPDISVALIGPSSLSRASLSRLRDTARVSLLGGRSYASVPAYLQHADVIVIPHVVSPFTESLDPIKAYECLASGRPTVATPVAGFRGHAGRIAIATPEEFVARVTETLNSTPVHAGEVELPTWADRAQAFERILLRAQELHRS